MTWNFFKYLLESFLAKPLKLGDKLISQDLSSKPTSKLAYTLNMGCCFKLGVVNSFDVGSTTAMFSCLIFESIEKLNLVIFSYSGSDYPFDLKLYECPCAFNDLSIVKNLEKFGN